MSSVPDTASEARMVSVWRAEPEEGSTGSESFSILQPAHAEFPDSQVPHRISELSADPNAINPLFPAGFWKKRKGQNEASIYLLTYHIVN